MKHDPWRFALCGSFNGCGFRSLFHFAALLTGTLRAKYRQWGAWPDHGLIWSFHFSGELGAWGQSQAYRFAARLQYLQAINSLAVTVFVQHRHSYWCFSWSWSSVAVNCLHLTDVYKWLIWAFICIELTTQTVERFWTVSVCTVETPSSWYYILTDLWPFYGQSDSPHWPYREYSKNRRPIEF